MSHFGEEYKKLNTAQKEAVDQLDGPVLVVAGPGTGKTQLLSMRVANILDKTDTAANNILCLTFTEKAATNMRERLVQLIGSEARNVVVKTFHGFGAEIINTFPDYFWNSAQLVPAPDGVQTEIVHTILNSLPLSSPLALRFGGNPTLTADVVSALNDVKNAGLTPGKLKAITAANTAYLDAIETELRPTLGARLSLKALDTLAEAIAQLPDQPIAEKITPLQPLSTVIKDSFEQAYTQAHESNTTKPVSDWKRKWWKKVGDKDGFIDERKRNTWWQHLSDVYEVYRQALRDRGYFDYADMIIEVITQLEQNEELRADVQERFSYVLIDEFQDTNEAQMRLAHLVADHHSAEGKPNIMVVGDDDQSIFKFQGAELNNLLNFRRSYPSSKIVVLTENYRSNQNVLDFAQKIIVQAEHRLVTHEKDIEKNITAAAKHKPGTIEHLSYQSQPDQYADLAGRIKQSFESEARVAVIARTNQSLRDMAHILQLKDVPVYFYQRNNVFNHPIAQHLILLAKIVHAIGQGDEETTNELLPRVLRHPHWNIDAKQLWQIALDNRFEPHWLTSLQNLPELQPIATWFDEVTQLSTIEPLAVMIERLLGLAPGSAGNLDSFSNYYQREQSLNASYLSGLSAVRTLRALVGDLGWITKPGLEGFLNLVSVYEDNDLILADESPFVSATKAVELMSVHKAKGLEFDDVFIIDAIEPQWKPSTAKRKPPANLQIQPAGDTWDDYVRLMFVAVTRAASSVTISSFRTNSRGSEVLATPIISSIEPNITKQITGISDSPVHVLQQALQWPSLATSDKSALLADTLETYQLSVTHLINFLDVVNGGPQHFFERNLLRLPEAKTPSQAHGTAMHSTMEFAQHVVNTGKAIDISALISHYQSALAREQIARGDFERWKVEGADILKRLFGELDFAPPKGSQAERRVKDITLGIAKLNGTFDRVDLGKDTVHIVDYKTGSPVSKLDSTSKTDGVRAWRQRTQLVFYALLVENVPEFTDKAMTGAMIYLHAEAQKDLVKSYTPTKEDKERLASLIQVVWKQIQNLDFPDTSNYSADYAGVQQFENDLLG